MQEAEVISPWTGGTSFAVPYRPEIGLDYSVLVEDETGQPNSNISPEPNYVQVHIRAEDAVMALIEADNKYTIVIGPEPI